MIFMLTRGEHPKLVNTLEFNPCLYFFVCFVCLFFLETGTIVNFFIVINVGDEVRCHDVGI